MAWRHGVRSIRAAISRRRGLALSEEAKVRAVSVGLWVLVALAALGGLVALVRTPDAPDAVREDAEDRSIAESWAAAGFGVRFVSAYLSGPESGADLAPFLGYSPELAPSLEKPSPPSTVTVVATESAGDHYWAVTLAAAWPGHEERWRVGVVVDDGRRIATGLPTPAAAGDAGERAALALVLSSLPEVDDPLLEAVAGFVSAYVCGQGEVARYLAPGVTLAAVDPAICTEARIVGWGTAAVGERRVQVVTEALLDPDRSARRVAFSLVLARRAGRWEVAELLPAPPLKTDQEVDR